MQKKPSALVSTSAELRSAAGWRRLPRVNYDEDKIDEVTLALLFLTLHGGCRAWKGFDWDVMDRLHQKGMIADPKGKAKSVMLTDDGIARCEELFKKHFGKPSPGEAD